MRHQIAALVATLLLLAGCGRFENVVYEPCSSLVPPSTPSTICP